MKLLMCNLKANKNLNEMEEYISKIQGIKNKENLVVFPSALYLPLFKEKGIVSGAQDISEYTESKSTGEILAEQIKSVGASYVIVGHSERRMKNKEDELIILKKIKNAIDADLKVVYCIGETKEERLRKKTYQVLEKQLARVFNNIDKNAVNNIIIAYEPIWAVGNGVTANKNDILEITSFIKKIILDYYDIDIKVVYGGSVNSNNINDYLNIDYIDGFLIGAASIDALEVTKLLDVLSK